MNPNVLGYFLTLLNIHALGGRDSQLGDVSLKVDTIPALKETILSYPGFTIEMFKSNGFIRVGNIGLYVSNDLRKYMFRENVDPNFKGLLIILTYEPRENKNEYTEKSNQNEAVSYLMRLENFNENHAKAYLQYVSESSGR